MTLSNLPPGTIDCPTHCGPCDDPDCISIYRLSERFAAANTYETPPTTGHIQNPYQGTFFVPIDSASPWGDPRYPAARRTSSASFTSTVPGQGGSMYSMRTPHTPMRRDSYYEDHEYGDDPREPAYPKCRRQSSATSQASASGSRKGSGHSAHSTYSNKERPRPERTSTIEKHVNGDGVPFEVEEVEEPESYTEPSKGTMVFVHRPKETEAEKARKAESRKSHGKGRGHGSDTATDASEDGDSKDPLSGYHKYFSRVRASCFGMDWKKNEKHFVELKVNRSHDSLPDATAHWKAVGGRMEEQLKLIENISTNPTELSNAAGDVQRSHRMFFDTRIAPRKFEYVYDKEITHLENDIKTEIIMSTPDAVIACKIDHRGYFNDKIMQGITDDLKEKVSRGTLTEEVIPELKKSVRDQLDKSYNGFIKHYQPPSGMKV